jgi:micrococcal nuclease
MPDTPKIQPSPDLIYWYGGAVRRVYDGDTIHADIDVGLNIELKYQRISLARINAPELRGRSRARGREARAFLADLIEGKNILLNTGRDTRGKYGRWVADVYVFDYRREWFCVNDEMLKAGHAVPLAD